MASSSEHELQASSTCLHNPGDLQRRTRNSGKSFCYYLLFKLLSFNSWFFNGKFFGLIFIEKTIFEDLDIAVAKVLVMFLYFKDNLL
jgi:hypothetical protein